MSTVGDIRQLMDDLIKKTGVERNAVSRASGIGKKKDTSGSRRSSGPKAFKTAGKHTPSEAADHEAALKIMSKRGGSYAKAKAFVKRAKAVKKLPKDSKRTKGSYDTITSRAPARPKPKPKTKTASKPKISQARKIQARSGMTLAESKAKAKEIRARRK